MGLPRKISIVYAIESLCAGGAQRQLVELLSQLNREQFDLRVLTWFPDDYFRPQVENLGIPVHTLTRRGKLDLGPVLQMVRWLRSGEIDLVHAYLNSASAYAVAARKIARRGKVIASERCTMLQETGLSRHYTPWAYRHANLVIANSARARAEILQVLGFADDRVLFIPNGVDTDRFSPVDNKERIELRRKLGWDESHRIVLTVASYKSQKNYLGIVHALEGLDLTNSSLRFCWAGPLAPADGFARVAEQIEQAGLGNFIQILGERSDVADLYRACDLVLLNSLWEGTPNVVLEAMSCGRPVIATDVSDVREYVMTGDNGWLIQPNNSSELREALIAVSQLGNSELDQLGLRGQHHLSNMGLDSFTLGKRHEKVYIELLK